MRFVTEILDLQEAEQRSVIVQSVADRSACQTPAPLGFQVARRFEILTRSVPNAMGFKLLDIVLPGH